MREFLFEDCNNNAGFLKKLFIEIQKFYSHDLIWEISNLDILSLPQKDYIEGTRNPEIEKVYEFSVKVLNEHKVAVSNSCLLDILDYTKTIYYVDIVSNLDDGEIKIKIFDGNFITVYCDFEEKLLLTE